MTAYFSNPVIRDVQRMMLFIIFICCALAVNAQQNNNTAKMPRYIEVVMSDTVMVQPDNLTFRIGVNYNSVQMPAVDTAAARKTQGYYLQRDSLQKLKMQEAKDALIKKLGAAGINLLPPSIQENTQVYGAYPSPFSVNVPMQQVSQLMRIAKGPPPFSVTYISGLANDEEPEYARLMTKLKAKAEVRAAQLAAGYGKEVGDLLTIAEYRNYNTPYNNYSLRNQPGDPVTEIDGKMVNVAYQIHNTIMVRYGFK